MQQKTQDTTKRTQSKTTIEMENANESDQEQSTNKESKSSEDVQDLKTRKFRRRTQSRDSTFNTNAVAESWTEPIHTDQSEAAVVLDTEQMDTQGKEHNIPPSASTRIDPASVYSGIPVAHFYDTKLYPSHLMNLHEIDQELQDLESKRDENRHKMSDYLAEHLNKINGTDYTSKLAATSKTSGSLSARNVSENAISSKSPLSPTIHTPIASIGSDTVGLLMAPQTTTVQLVLVIPFHKNYFRNTNTLTRNILKKEGSKPNMSIASYPKSQRHITNSSMLWILTSERLE